MKCIKNKKEKNIPNGFWQVLDNKYKEFRIPKKPKLKLDIEYFANIIYY